MLSKIKKHQSAINSSILPKHHEEKIRVKDENDNNLNKDKYELPD